MNKDTIAGNWEQLKGQVQKQWGKLTDYDLDVLQGDQKLLAGKLQERYSITKEDAELQAQEFFASADENDEDDDDLDDDLDDDDDDLDEEEESEEEDK